MKKILIVSYHFPPLNSMAAKRFGFMCKYFEKYGYEPYVITAKPVNGSYLKCGLELPIPIRKDRIFTFGVIGRNNRIENPFLSEIISLYQEKNREARAINYESIAWYEKVKKEINLDSFSNVDLVIGTFPFAGNLYIAKYIAKKLHIPYVVDIRDLISDYDESCDRGKLYSYFERLLEFYLIGGSSGIVTVTKGFSQTLRRRYKKKTVTVYNGWDEEYSLCAESVKEKYLYYAGSLYAHRLESLTVLLGALSETDGINIKIRSLGPEGLERQLRATIEKKGLTERVQILGAAPEEIVQKEQAKAYINLIVSSISDKDEALLNTLPGKLFELLHVNSPIIAVASEKCEMNKILRQCNKGIATSDSSAIASFISQKYIYYTGNNNIECYSRKRQSEKMCDFFGALLR